MCQRRCLHSCTIHGGVGGNSLSSEMELLVWLEVMTSG